MTNFLPKMKRKPKKKRKKVITFAQVGHEIIGALPRFAPLRFAPMLSSPFMQNVCQNFRLAGNEFHAYYMRLVVALSLNSLKQRFLTFFGLFPYIDFYYDCISHPTILVHVNMRHFIENHRFCKKPTEHPNKL